MVWQPVAIIVMLLLSALAAWLGGQAQKRLVSVLSVLVPLAGCALLLPLAKSIAGGTVYTAHYRILPPTGLSFRLDSLSFYFAVTFLLLGAVLAFYTSAFPLGEEHSRFRGVMLFVLACSLGVVMAGDLLSLFLFFEGMSLTYFILAIHLKDRESIGATFKFLYMTVGASVLYFIAMAAVYFQAGTLTWKDGGIMPAGPLTLLAFIGFLAAFGMKAGMVPLHIWMADVYGSAPVPAAILSSIIMLKTGAYGLIRVFYQVLGPDLLRREGWQGVMLALSVVTIIYGSVCAFADRNLMRRLAYSGVAQLGYILLGTSLLTQEALTGGIFHVVAHALMKGTLLMCAGAIYIKTGKRHVGEMAGIGWEMPLTMCCFSVAALTAVGLPPLNIFVTKWYLSLGALSVGEPLIIVVLLISSMLNAAYYLPIAFLAFFGKRNRDMQARLRYDKVPFPTAAAMLIFAAGCIAFNLGSVNLPLQWALKAAASFF